MFYITKNFIFFLFVIISLTSCGSDRTISSDTTSLSKNATIYEDAEDGTNNKWEVYQGPYDVKIVDFGAKGSEHSVLLRQNWHKEDGQYVSGVYYRLTNEEHSNWDNTTQKVLHFDHMKKRSSDGSLYCFTVGVEVDTSYGKRTILFNTYFDKKHYPPDVTPIEEEDTVQITFPLLTSSVNSTKRWQHVSLDIEKYLHKIEPNNKLISINAFIVDGGDDYFDNIALDSQ